MFLWSSFRTMGIELSDFELSIVHLTKLKRSIKRVRSISIALPQGLVQDGMIVEPEALLTHVRSNTKKWRWNEKRINLLAPSQHVINRYIRLPDVSEGLSRLVTQEVKYQLHFPFEDPLWDYHDMGPSEMEAGKRDIMISAVSSNIVSSQLDFFKRLNLTPTAVDIRGAALLRVVNQMIDQRELPETYAVLHIGKCTADLAVYHKEQLRFNRNIPYQMNDYAELLEVAATSENGTESAVNGNISHLITDLRNELSRSINFFKFSILNQDVPLEKVYITGDYPLLLEAVKNAGSEFALTFESLMDHVQWSRDIQISNQTMTGLGLALKKAGYSL
jgi:type IV pilus assembly protein PilM